MVSTCFTNNGLEKAVDINAQMSTLDARISKCIEDALEPFWRELRARGLMRGCKQHDSHTPCGQHSSHINNIKSHNLTTTETTPALVSSHISNSGTHKLNTDPTSCTSSVHNQPSPPPAGDNSPTTICSPATSGSTTLGSVIHPRSSAKGIQKSLVTPPAVTTPVFQIVARLWEYGFAIHCHLFMCLSVVAFDILQLCILPPIYKHEFEPPPIKAMSCLQPWGQGYFSSGSIDIDRPWQLREYLS